MPGLLSNAAEYVGSFFHAHLSDIVHENCRPLSLVKNDDVIVDEMRNDREKEHMVIKSRKTSFKVVYSRQRPIKQENT